MRSALLQGSSGLENTDKTEPLRPRMSSIGQVLMVKYGGSTPAFVSLRKSSPTPPILKRRTTAPCAVALPSLCSSLDGFGNVRGTQQSGVARNAFILSSAGFPFNRLSIVSYFFLIRLVKSTSGFPLISCPRPASLWTFMPSLQSLASSHSVSLPVKSSTGQLFSKTQDPQDSNVSY